MEQIQYSDEKLIDMIRLTGEDRKTALRVIFLSWRSISKAIMMKSGANAEDADDAIQESILVLDNHIRNGKYQNTGSLRNYFIGICKGRIYSNRRSTKRIEWTDDHLKMDGIEIQQPETLMLKEEQKSIIQDMVNMLDKTCREVLKFYKLSYSMEEIAEMVGLGKANNARQRVFNCRKRLVKLVASNPSFANYFKNQA